MPTFIHVGFMNSGTTSLQRNFFSKRPEFLYVGEPYGDRGGIFTNIKSVEDYLFDHELIRRLCVEQIYKERNERPIVISDESFCDTPQIHFPPFMLSRDHIALRLKRFFPDARIIFTIREQRRYVISMYLNLKRNSAFFDRCAVPSFSRWLNGTLSQIRCHYLHNLDYSEAIGLYTKLFGRQNICVLPLEMIGRNGERAYLQKLCNFMDIELRDVDVINFKTVQNPRMSVRKNLVAELRVDDDRFDALLADLAETFGTDEVEAFLDGGPRAELSLSPYQEELIRSRVSCGNRLLADEFGLDLESYGYVTVEPDEAEPLRAAIVRSRLKSARGETDLMEIAREVEIRSLRQEISDLAAKGEQQLAEAGRQLAESERRIAEEKQRFVEADQELKRQRLALEHAAVAVAQIKRLERLERELADMRQSTSWRITAPLRQVSEFIAARRRHAQ